MREKKIVTDISEGTSLNNMVPDEGLLLFKQISNLIAKNDSMFYLGEGNNPQCFSFLFLFFFLKFRFFFFLKVKTTLFWHN